MVLALLAFLSWQLFTLRKTRREGLKLKFQLKKTATILKYHKDAEDEKEFDDKLTTLDLTKSDLDALKKNIKPKGYTQA